MLENTLTSCNYILFVMLIGVATALSASPAALIDDATHFDLVISTNEGTELNLEVIHMPLSEVLDKIAFKSKVPIHYSILPKGYF